MKRTYVNRLPKNEEVKNTNVRVENGQLFVEVEFEDKFKPKFGDIVRIEYPGANEYKRQYVISIFPDKKVPQKSVVRFFDIASIDMNGNIRIEDDAHSYYNYKHVFLASESEKQELFDKLAEVGKRWNPETKQLEDIRWRAKLNKEFCYVSSHGKVYYRIDNMDNYSNDLCEVGNYFRTPEAAQKVADRIKEIFKNSKAE